jgi:hypothetical protein
MAAGLTYVPIATQIVSGSSTSTVTFSSIPQTYTDLQIVTSVSCSSSAAATALYIRFNSDSATNYSYTYLYGTGSTTAGARFSNQSTIYFGSAFVSDITTNTGFVNSYSNTSIYKTCISRESASKTETVATIGLWRSTAGISTIDLFINGYVFTAGSTFTLYGIAAA